jgi:hypothetical protein
MFFRKMFSRWALLVVVSGSFLSHAAQPTVPLGLDAYRKWDRWPYQRIGVRAYMRSTYDRLGGNHSADASHFLFQLNETNNVTLDVAGPGVLYFARYNHWHGSPWHYIVDGADHVVQESSTADPNHPVENSVFQPAELFPKPLTWTWSVTKGADLMWVPIPFEQSFRMAYGRTRYGTGYYIYHQFVGGTPLSQPIRAWDGRTPPATDVLQLMEKSGTDIAPNHRGKKAASGEFSLAARQTVTLLHQTGSKSVIRALKLSVPREQAAAFSKARLRITWDNRREPSVDAPVALFFGAGVLYNRDNREFLVKAFPMNIRYEADRVHLACYYPMPFFRSAKIEMVGDGTNDFSGVRYEVRSEPFKDPPNHVGYFHATYRDFPKPVPGKDLVCLDTRQAEGGGDWSGSLVGMSWIFSHRADLGTLEGDPRFFFDDSLTPQAYGTGTEEWGGGGDYWGGRNMTIPLAGHPTGCRNEKEAKNELDKIESAYRFLLADLMPFGRNAVIQLEHGAENQSSEHYETVTYWYGLPAASLIQTDELKIGDRASEFKHAYRSPQASAPYDITSRYELGIDSWKGQEVYPAHTDKGRKTIGESEFTLKIDPRNLGVMLRRKLDYAFPNQRAEVYVADASRNRTPQQSDWKLAGIWYLAGGNTCVFSDPKEELGSARHDVETSNRRFRDDEFLLPQSVTKNRSAIRVRVRFVPVSIPLFPGHPVPELAWSEVRYTAYSFLMPEFKMGRR